MSRFYTVYFCAEAQCSCGFRPFLFVQPYPLRRCVNIQKSSDKTARNSFWTLMSIFLSLLVYQNTRLHGYLAFVTPAWNVDTPYYRNPCISGRILWILLRNDSAFDTIPRVWERRKRIPWLRYYRVFQKEKRTALHEVFWAASEKQRRYTEYPDPSAGLRSS